MKPKPAIAMPVEELLDSLRGLLEPEIYLEAVAQAAERRQSSEVRFRRNGRRIRPSAKPRDGYIMDAAKDSEHR
mgnify:CR=1 FL=1